MAGPRLEIFKYGFYVFFPIGMMIWVGDYTFYEKYVRGVPFYPDLRNAQKPGLTKDEILKQLEEFKEKRRIMKEENAKLKEQEFKLNDRED